MQHGGDLTDIRARHGGAGDAWLDLSTGINPHAWPVPADLGAAAWRRLPAAEDLAGLVAAARLAYRVPAAAGVVAAPGTQALIQWLPRLAAPSGSEGLLDCVRRTQGRLRTPPLAPPAAARLAATPTRAPSVPLSPRPGR